METAWQIAGLKDEGGNLTRPVQTSSWRVPAVIDLIQGNSLRWRYDDEHHGLGKMVSVQQGLLDDFVQLAFADPEDMLKFARQCGVLLICQHGKPARHSWPRGPIQDTLNSPSDGSWCGPIRSPDAYCESLGLWYRLAGQAQAMLNVAAALLNEKPARHGDWATVVHRRWLGNDARHPSLEWLDALNKPRHAASARLFVEDSVRRQCKSVAWVGGCDPRVRVVDQEGPYDRV